MKLDFADPKVIELFPAHGWSLTSEGIKVLRLPILRLVHEADHRRREFGLQPLGSEQWQEIRAFASTVGSLALSLRELARNVRIGSEPHFEKHEHGQWSKSNEALDVVPLFLDLAIVYLRRLADHFARAIRFALFQHAESAPREYKSLRSLVSNSERLVRLKPVCDGALLQEAFEKHSSWIDKLRDSIDSGSTRKGVRDILEHRAATISIQPYKLGSDPWLIGASVGNPLGKDFRFDLLPQVRVAMSDLASLWTGVSRATELRRASQEWIAPYGDALILTGDDADCVEFWPRIGDK